MTTIRDLLQLADQIDSDTPLLDAQLLLCHAIDCSRTYLYTWPEKNVAPDQAALYRTLVKKRSLGTPIAYLVGHQEFWSLPIKVSPATLIPRADTETLVERVLQLHLPQHARILDLGTGTGAIALALAKERPDWQLVAVDKEPEAVGLARENAANLTCSNVQVERSDWFDQVSGQFDLIVSNPPYIDEADEHLLKGDVQFEPRTALVAGEGGLHDLTYIITSSLSFLVNGGYLVLEHGNAQAYQVRRQFLHYGYTKVKTSHDLAGLDRVTEGQRLA